METMKNQMQRTSDLGVAALSLCAARPILSEQLAAVKGTSVSGTVGIDDARVLSGVPSIKAGEAVVAGDVRPTRDRAYAITTTIQKFADGVGSSVTWRPPV